MTPVRITMGPILVLLLAAAPSRAQPRASSPSAHASASGDAATSTSSTAALGSPALAGPVSSSTASGSPPPSASPTASSSAPSSASGQASGSSASPLPSSAPTEGAASPAAPSTTGGVFASALRAYHAALLARRLGRPEIQREDVSARVAEAEGLMASGRLDEAVARLVEIVEHPSFQPFADSEEGRAAVFRLGDALASAGIAEPARDYLRRLVEAKDAWNGYGSAQVWARRAVRRIVDVALESQEYGAGVRDLKEVPASAPDEVRGEIAYMAGRAAESVGNWDAALAAYAGVPQRSRFWAQATYLSGLIHVEHGDLKRGEDLLCKVADPKRSAATTPVFADEKFFAVRDLARLGLGRIAHEQGRNDDARYYYYLVPQDSDRLAEALYEAATTRYEKKDYDGAHELLDELAALGIRHRYEDEAWVLGAWVDLARCRFADADRKLAEFLARYEPVRDAARRIGDSDAAMQQLLSAVRSGADAGGAVIGGASPDVVRTIAALVRIDTEYDRVVRRRAVLEREASGLVVAMSALGDMQRALATNGGVRPASDVTSDRQQEATAVRDAVAGVERQIADLETAHARSDEVGRLRQQLSAIRAQVPSSGAAGVSGVAAVPSRGTDLPDLFRGDSSEVSDLQRRIAAARELLEMNERALAKDALRRLDLRLSRLLRRARLGRIESVLGRKHALEIEVEAIRLGYLPRDAVDSLDAARYLEDSEEYWPFEGDDWPDEYVGGELR
jgi:tetratricopeptide (TPR) repeat protein